MYRIEICLVLGSGWKLTFFYAGVKTDFGFECGPKRTAYLVSIFGSKLTWFSAWGSKLSWFLCARRKRLGFSVGIDWRSFCAGGRNWLGFGMLAETHSVFVWATNSNPFMCLWLKLTWFHCGGSKLVWLKLTWFHCGGSKLVWFQWTDRNWLGLVWGSKMIWFKSFDRNLIGSV